MLVRVTDLVREAGQGRGSKKWFLSGTHLPTLTHSYLMVGQFPGLPAVQPFFRSQNFSLICLEMINFVFFENSKWQKNVKIYILMLTGLPAWSTYTWMYSVRIGIKHDDATLAASRPMIYGTINVVPANSFVPTIDAITQECGILLSYQLFCIIILFLWQNR